MQSFSRAIAIVLALLLSLGAAQAAPLLLVDARTYDVLYADDAGQPWHPASLTKMMTSYVAFTAIKEGRITLDTPITISRRAWNLPPSKSGLAVGSRITMRDALYLLVVKSANDIAVAIAEAVSGSEPAFVAEMNRMARTMGLTATNYVNAHGLHHAQQVSSARDLAVLTLYLQRDFERFMPMFGTESVTLGKEKFPSNNGLLGHFAGVTGMKTGYICASGLNIVATATRDGRSLIAVVLGGSSARERNELAAEMLLRGFSGAYGPTGRSVLSLANLETPAEDMRPLICGKQAREYVRGREAAFPMGMKGQPSYLTDLIEGPTYRATDLGIVVDFGLPRARPPHQPRPERLAAVAPAKPAAPAASAANVVSGLVAPVPRPRLQRD